MIDERTERLLNEVQDGEASAEDRSRLREILDRDSAARAAQEDLERLGSLLGSVAVLEPPPGLKDRVLARIREDAPPARVPSRPGFWSRWFDASGRQAWVRYGYTFIGGLAVGIGVLALLGRGPIGLGTSDLGGTLVPGGPDLSSAHLVDAATLDLPGVTGRVATRVLDGVLYAEVEIVARLRDPAPGILAFRAERAGQGSVTASGGEWRVAHRGENTYWIVLGPADRVPSGLMIEVVSEGRGLDHVLRTRPAED
jgi:hypothetical protein